MTNEDITLVVLGILVILLLVGHVQVTQYRLPRIDRDVRNYFNQQTKIYFTGLSDLITAYNELADVCYKELGYIPRKTASHFYMGLVPESPRRIAIKDQPPAEFDRVKTSRTL